MYCEIILSILLTIREVYAYVMWTIFVAVANKGDGQALGLPCLCNYQMLFLLA